MAPEGLPSTYTAYVLRCWLEGTSWRYSLEEVGTGKRQGFATLDEFISFMVAQSALIETGESNHLELDPAER